MTFQFIKSNKVASLILATFTTFCSFSQEAEKLYHEQYSKLSFVFQPAILQSGFAANRGKSQFPVMKFNDSQSIQFGVFYNFAQSGNFNFKTGLIVKDFSPSFDIKITGKDIGYDVNYLLSDFDPYNQFIFSIPIKTEFLLPISPKFNLTFGASLNLNLITGINEEVITNIGVTNSSFTLSKNIYFSKTDNQEKINFTSEISSGIQYKSKYALMQLDLFWTFLSAPTPVTGSYVIYNLDNIPDIRGDFKIDPFFYGISLVVSPKKGWLKKQK